MKVLFYHVYKYVNITFESSVIQGPFNKQRYF